MRRMGDIIVQAAELTQSSIPLLRSMHHNASRLNSFSEEILRIEDEADDLHDQGLSALFRTHRNSDVMAFIGSWRRVSTSSKASPSTRPRG